MVRRLASVGVTALADPDVDDELGGPAFESAAPLPLEVEADFGGLPEDFEAERAD